MKRCELCKSMASIYCESDRASLCWACDAKVHSANFLVARHSRTLLCQRCQSPTPWTASGDKLWPSTRSICRTCVVEGVSDGVGGHNDDSENYDAIADDGNEIHNQGPPVASSSSTEDQCVLLKRKYQNVFADSSNEEINSVAEGDETGSFHLTKSSTGDKRNIKSGVRGHLGKTRRTAEFDLNLSAVE